MNQLELYETSANLAYRGVLLSRFAYYASIFALLGPSFVGEGRSRRREETATVMCLSVVRSLGPSQRAGGSLHRVSFGAGPENLEVAFSSRALFRETC